MYPAFHLSRGLAALSGAPLLATEVSSGAALEVLALRDGGRTVVWLANLTDRAVTADLPDDIVDAARISRWMRMRSRT